jgi:hypothetical protein
VTTQLLCVSGFSSTVEPLGRRSGAARCSRLLDPTVGPREEPDSNATNHVEVLAAATPRPAVFIVIASVAAFATASSATFIITALSTATLCAVTLSATTFVVMASLVVFAVVASSTILVLVAFSGAAAAVETSIAIEVDPPPSDPLDDINAATLGSGCGVVAALGTCCPDSGGSLTVDPPLLNCLLLLYRGTSSSSDDTSVSPSMTRGTTMPFSLPELGPVLALPWPSAKTAQGYGCPGTRHPSTAQRC